ncbi:MAG: DUF5012 domain-containing protein [Mediterranea sp.]|nr:DUF5012 domain-containing protein [Mediterranea sp.]
MITKYVTLERLGDANIVVTKGSTYVEPGYTAELEGQDVSSSVVITGTVDTNTTGIYVLTYSAKNKDGFEKKFTRTIYVADATPSPLESGVYTVASGTQRVASSGNTAYSGYDIAIYQTAPGIFYTTDYWGGYYDQRAGYGTDYAMAGEFTLNADKTLTLNSSHNNGWNDGLNSLLDATLNATNDTLRWTARYTPEGASYDFKVILTKK